MHRFSAFGAFVKGDLQLILKLLKPWRRKLEKMGIINPSTTSRMKKDWLTHDNSTKSNTCFCQYTISVVCSLYFQMKSFLAANKNSPEHLLRSSLYCPRNGDSQSLRLAGKCVFTGNSNRCFFLSKIRIVQWAFGQK